MKTGKHIYTSVEKGQPVTDEGRYVTIWHRQSDGNWKIIADMGVPKN
jgi:ketosteroid isomerase-like protein